MANISKIMGKNGISFNIEDTVSRSRTLSLQYYHDANIIPLEKETYWNIENNERVIDIDNYSRDYLAIPYDSQWGNDIPTDFQDLDITTLYIPETITQISYDAFQSSSLTDVYFLGNYQNEENIDLADILDFQTKFPIENENFTVHCIKGSYIDQMLPVEVNKKYIDINPYQAVVQNDLDIKMDKVNPTGEGSFSLNAHPFYTTGNYSFTEGYYCGASGNSSHAEGNGSISEGNSSHAEGIGTEAEGNSSHAEGNSSHAKGENSHAEGKQTSAEGEESHAEGYSTEALGIASHSGGSNTTAKGAYSFAHGNKTQADGLDSAAFGKQTLAAGEDSFIVGNSKNSAAEQAYIQKFNLLSKGDIVRSNDLPVENQELGFQGKYNLISFNNYSNKTHAIRFNNLSMNPSYTKNNRYLLVDCYLDELMSNFSLSVTFRSTYGTGGTDNWSTIYAQSDEIKKATSSLYNSKTWVTVAIDCQNALNYLYDNNLALKQLEISLPEINNGTFYINDIYFSPNTTGDPQLKPDEDILNDWENENNKFAMASGLYSYVEGSNSLALGKCSHAEGNGTVASGNSSHSEGTGSKATGKYAHAGGLESIANGECSVAMGREVHANGDSAFAEGGYTYAIGKSSHAEGGATQAYGENSHAEGNYSKAIGNNSHAGGSKTIAYGECSVATGQSDHLAFDIVTDTRINDVVVAANKSTRNSTHLELIDDFIDTWNTEEINPETGKIINYKFALAAGEFSKIEGANGLALAKGAHAEGNGCVAAGKSSHAEGTGSKAIGNYSHAGGLESEARGNYSFAQGYRVKSTGISSVAIGRSDNINTGNATGTMSIAIGQDVVASGTQAISMGSRSQSSGETSVAIGTNAKALHNYAIALGNDVITGKNNQVVIGKNNEVENDALLVIGNGTANDSRSNAHTLDWSGNAWFAGNITDGNGNILSDKANSNNAILTGTPTAPTAASGTNTTQIATTAFVNNAFAANDAMLFKGTIGTNGTVSTLPTTHSIGWTYKVVEAGSYAGQVCEIGDMLICVEDGEVSDNTHWIVVQSNLDGAVTGPASAVADHVVTFNDTTGKVVKDSGYTIATSVPPNAIFTDTTYTSQPGSQGGTTESLVTTGEKYSWNNKADANNAALTGVPTAPTAAAGTNTTQIATTEFVANAVSTKADIPEIINIADTTYVLTAQNNKEYRFGEMTSLEIELPTTTPNDYATIIHFTSGATPPSLTYPSTVIWSGADISIDTDTQTSEEYYKFDVQANTRYSIALEYDGTYVKAYEMGTELIV